MSYVTMPDGVKASAGQIHRLAQKINGGLAQTVATDVIVKENLLNLRMMRDTVDRLERELKALHVSA